MGVLAKGLKNICYQVKAFFQFSYWNPYFQKPFDKHFSTICHLHLTTTLNTRLKKILSEHLQVSGFLKDWIKVY